MSVPSKPLLSVRDLTVRFGDAAAVDAVSFDLMAGETLGVVGESGSGKSSIAQAILRLNEGEANCHLTGSVQYESRDLLSLSPQKMQALRGGQIAMIFQDPMSSLNPVMTVGRQIAEAIEVHGERAETTRIHEALEEVGLADPHRVAGRYPHELSGGMQQRVMIAMALVMKPHILLADEPTTALDVTVQAQILDLIANLGAERGMSVLFITHDLGALAHLADRVMVMYAGQVVEIGEAPTIYRRPAMPYTADLLAATPRPGQRDTPLRPIAGSQPPPGARPAGCAYAPRCRYAAARCNAERPALMADRTTHRARCHFTREELASHREAAE